MSKRKNILVTGGAGYIGSHTVVELYKAGFHPIIVDDFRNSKPWIISRIESIIGNKVDCHSVDCTDQQGLASVAEKYDQIDGVIHFAAYKAVGESVEKPVLYYQNNINSLCSILQLMQYQDIKHLVFSSSCTVYGEPENPEVTEKTAIKKAASPYGATKICCEELIQYAYASPHELCSTLLRYFNPIGAHPSAEIGELPQGIPNNLVPYITQTANGVREELTVNGDDYSTADGTCIRDYIHVVDLAKAHVKALQWSFEQQESFCEAFNLGTGKGSSVLEIIHTFEKVNGLKLNYKIGPRRPGDVEQIWANPSKANKWLGWTCQYGIEDALKHSWEWEKNIEKS
ncbi:MAG: UDP-glucose 4-epimerase GalE [Crocinitomicaceae bacterium]